MIFVAIGFFLLLVGLIVGLGAVTVIDIHGYLARFSRYWTLATIRTHKVTKPLIWAGIVCHMCGLVVLHAFAPIILPWLIYQYGVSFVLMANGVYLSFFVSPMLVLREKEGKAQELLPLSLQRSIFGSFIISFLGWWSLVCFTILTLVVSIV